MWHNPAHMTAGHAAAAKSRKTPKHLIPHLKGLAMNSSTNAGRHSAGSSIGGVALKSRGGQSAPAGNSPTTSQPKFKPPAKIGGRSAMNDGSTQQAEQQIAASPMPFQNPKAAANLPAPPGPTDATGNGKSINRGGLPTSKAPKHPPTGPTGGYKPKKNYGPVGKPSFYGSR